MTQRVDTVAAAYRTRYEEEGRPLLSIRSLATTALPHCPPLFRGVERGSALLPCTFS